VKDGVGPTRIEVTNDGLSIAALDWGGDGPDLLFLHGNGFCAGAFDPLARRLRTRFRPVAVDLRATVRARPLAFGRLRPGPAGDRCPRRGGCARSPSPTIVGESFGGAVAVLVDLLRPSLAAALLLCEPIVVSPSSDLITRIPSIVEMTLRRRSQWSSRDEARRSYADRPPFVTFAPEALDRVPDLRLRGPTRRHRGAGVRAGDRSGVLRAHDDGGGRWLHRLAAPHRPVRFRR